MEWTQIFIPIVVSFAITVSVMPLFIGYFQMKKQGQVTREDGPTWHSVKTGTPTMGGSRFPCSQLDYFISNGVVFPPIYAVSTNYSIYFSIIRFARLFR